MGAKEDLSAKCTWIRVLKYDLTTGRQEMLRLEEEVDKDALLSPFLFNLYVQQVPH
jgi:hypothetical protein